MKTLSQFKSQINEVLKASDPIEKWIDDFVHSKNPKFAGKSNKERIEMAKGAYYGAQKNESASISQNTEPMVKMEEDHLVHVSDGSKYDDVPHPKDIEHIKTGAMYTGGQWHSHSDKGAFFKFKSKEDAEQFKRHVDKCPHKSCDAEHVTEAVEYKGIGTDVVDKKKKLNPQPNLTTDKKQVKDFKEDDIKKYKGKLPNNYYGSRIGMYGYGAYPYGEYGYDNYTGDAGVGESVQQFKEEKDDREYGYEGDMAMSQLKTIIRHSEHLMGMLKPDTDLPEWVQSKITLATDYMQTAHDYLMSEMNEEVEQIDEGENGLAAKAKKSGISLSTLKTVYKRGVAAWNSGHRPGTTPQQWGMARVNSYITKGSGTYGGADKDLHEDARLDKKEYHKGMSDSTAKARVAHWKKADKMSDSNPKAYEPAPGDKTAKTTPSVHTKKYHAMYGEGYEHGPIDRDAKVGVGHKAAVLAGSGLDSGKHGTVVGSSKERTGDMWHIKTASGDIVKMHKHRVAKLKEETVEEGKVYDPFTKKMVPTMPIKVQAGGGATRNGVPVTGPSKHKERPSRPGDIYGKSFTEEVELIQKHEVKADAPHKDGGHVILSKAGKNWHVLHNKKSSPSAGDLHRSKLLHSYDDEKAARDKFKELKEEQIDEVSKSTLMRYIPKASRDVADNVAMAKERQVTMVHATHAGNYDMANKESDKSKISFKKAMQRIKGIDTATKKLGTQKEEVELDEAIANPLPVQHAVNAVHKTLGSQAATRFLGHLKPGTDKHTTWDKVNDALVKQGVQTHHIASIAQKTSHANVNESRGHKVLATFFKNREVAQRAYQGNPAKDAEVAQGGGTPADQGIAAAKKDAEKLKKESVNPALMAILKKRQEAQKKKEEDKKKVNEAMTPAVHAAEPKRTKSTSKEYASASIPGTKRVARAKPDDNEVGGGTATRIKEDQYTADYKIKYYVDPITGENKTRKIRPHRVNFVNSKMRAEPAQADARGDYGSWKEEV